MTSKSQYGFNSQVLRMKIQEHNSTLDNHVSEVLIIPKTPPASRTTLVRLHKDLLNTPSTYDTLYSAYPITNSCSRPFLASLITLQPPIFILTLRTCSRAHHSSIIHPLYPISFSISPTSLSPFLQSFLKRCATLLLLASNLAGSVSHFRVLVGIWCGGGVGRRLNVG